MSTWVIPFILRVWSDDLGNLENLRNAIEDLDQARSSRVTASRRIDIRAGVARTTICSISVARLVASSPGLRPTAPADDLQVAALPTPA